MVTSYEVHAPLEYHLAIELSEQLKLRTLDLLHVAYTSILKRAKITDTLITGDEEVLESREQILNSAEVQVRHPRDVIMGVQKT
ncbi:MAG: hypothetical protein ACP5KW_06465 [Thermoproteota archaeon]